MEKEEAYGVEEVGNETVSKRGSKADENPSSILVDVLVE